MRTVTIGGKDCIVVAERNDEDGGIITNTLVPAGDGSYYNHRTWRGSGAQASPEERGDAQAEALDVFAALTDVEIAGRAAKATAPGVSGKLTREE